MSGKKARRDATPELSDAKAWRTYIYGLATQSAAKKPKSAADPTDFQAVETAAKKAAKDADAKLLLGLEPRDKVRGDATAGTGLRNLGATCYMNSLLQCLHMNVGFRRGIYKWAAAATSVGAGGGSSGQPPPAKAAAAATSTGSSRRPEELRADEVCRQLQLVFANLQHSDCACYDPAALTSALSLDVSVQQDVTEFRKLLLTFLEEQLKLSPEPSIQTLVQDHFGGLFCYHTQCSACHRPSDSSSTCYPFYELELNVRPTLQQALDEYIAVEHLNGNNQYECIHCHGHRDATRQIAIRQLPPVLCLQLLRFVYDPFKDAKKKVSDPIIFPELLDTSSFVFGPASAHSSNAPSGQAPHTYRLTAVLMHSGASAHSGHYTARILEQSPAARWLTVNDELVTEEDFDPAKAATKPKPNGMTLLKQSDPSGGRLFASHEAYMLMYTRDDVITQAQAAHAEVQAPVAVREAVHAANAELRAAAERYQDALHAHSERLTARQTLLDELRPILRSDGHDGRWIESRWLLACLTLGPRGPTDEVGPISNHSIECCHGGAADPKHVSTGAMKLISVAAWRKLHGLFEGGPELFAAGCDVCADAEWERRQLETAKETHKAALTSALNSASSSSLTKHAAVEANGGDGGMSHDDYYYVPRLTASRWARWLSEGQTDVTRELFCPHGELLRLEAHSRTIGAKAWGHLFALFPESTPILVEAVGRGDGDGRLVECAACLVSEGEREAAKADEKLSAKLEIASRSAQRQRLGRLLQEDGRLDPDVLRSSRPLYLLDGTWIAGWRHAMQSTHASKPGVPRGAECCMDHGKLLVRPELCVRNVMGLLPRNGSFEGGYGERSGSGGALSRLEAERDQRLGARLCMVTADEALQLANGASLSDLTDLRLPSCELRDDGSFVCQPHVCEECSTSLGQEVLRSLLEYTEQPVHLKKLAALPNVDKASGSGGDGGVGGSVDVADSSGGGGSGRPARRSSRASAGSKMSVRACSSINVLNLKLRIYQATEWSPSQQRLFIDGDELLDDEQMLSDAGVLPNSFIHVYIDTSRVAELPAIEEAFGSASGGKPRAPEDGFAGSALVSSSLGASQSAAAACESDASANVMDLT
jgi:ubiquitin carboxyl-terminal hydrolase 48